MANIWDKFDKAINLEGLKKDAEESAKNGGGNYKEVPAGSYEVSITKLELGESSKGDPMMKVWFKILAGDFEGSYLFMNQVLTSGFGLHTAKEFLRSLDVCDVEFESFSQFGNLLMDMMEKIEENGLEYAIEYGETKKGFKTFKVTEVFED